MHATTTSTQTIEETIAHEIYGGAVTTYSGTNVEPSTNITDGSATYDIVDTAEPWQLEITTGQQVSSRRSTSTAPST